MHVGKAGISEHTTSQAGDGDAGDAGGAGAARAGRGRPPSDQPIASASGSGLTRVTVNLNRHALHALETVSEATGYSKTDTINRALQVYEIVQEIMQRNGGVLNVRHDNGELERIHIV
jgi:hypothetical protein